MSPFALLFFLLGGCSVSPPSDVSPPSCADAACRQARALAAWAQEPAEGIRLIEALPDGVERSAAVARLMESDPAGVSELCDLLPQGKLRVRCQRTADRPHLWEGPTDPVPTGVRAAGGPRSHRLASVQTRTSVLLSVSGDLGLCISAPDPHTCAWARAMELGAKGQVREAAARCAGIKVEGGDVDAWQSECRFSAAEATIRAQGAAGYAGAAELCLSAGRFQERCLIHLSRDLAARAPAADGGSGPALEAMVEAAEAIGRFWADDAAAPKFVDHFWSLALGYAFQKAQTVTGDMLDSVPASVRPHVHAAAAWRLVALEGLGTHNLPYWLRALDVALASRAGGPERLVDAVHMPGVGNLWGVDVAADREVRAIIYMGMGRRGTSVSTASDRLICLLEAAARQDPPGMALLAEAAAIPDPAVRWTANRLLRVRLKPKDIKKGPGL